MRPPPGTGSADSFSREIVAGLQDGSGTPAACRREHSGSRELGVGRTSTSEAGGRRASGRRAVGERGVSKAVTTMSPTADPPATSLVQGSPRQARPVGSTAASSPRASCHCCRRTSPGRYSAARPWTASSARRPRSACTRKIEPAARTCTSKLSPTAASRIRVEQHGDLVVGRVLEPLDHQPRRGARSSSSAPCGATRPPGSRGRCAVEARGATYRAWPALLRGPARPPRRAGRSRRAAGRPAAVASPLVGDSARRGRSGSRSRPRALELVAAAREVRQAALHEQRPAMRAPGAPSARRAGRSRRPRSATRSRRLDRRLE